MGRTRDDNEPLTRQDTLLDTLEALMAIEATELKGALDQAADLLVGALGADKIDVSLHDPSIRAISKSCDEPRGRCLLTLFATTGAGRDARMRRVAVFGMLAARSRRRHADFEIALTHPSIPWSPWESATPQWADASSRSAWTVYP